MSKVLSNYLVEQILLTEESNSIKKTVVVYSGRFQPFHSGHYMTYQNLVKKFGSDSVYIGTSNVVNLPKSPFNFKEKSEIITTMFGIPKSHIIEIKNPYKPTEILNKFDKNTTAYVTVVGEKDENRLGGNYFTKYIEQPTEPYKDAGYIYTAPPNNGVSGTDVRNGLANGTEKEKQDFFKNIVYKKFNQKIFNLITDKLHESFEIQKETIEEWLLNESTINGEGQADDGPAGFFPNMEVFSKVSQKRAKQIGYDIIDMIMTGDVEDYYEHPEYPNGPVKAVSYFPAGVIGKLTPNNQVDIYTAGAYSDWYTHVTRKASLVGYQIVATQLQRNSDSEDKKLATLMAIADKEIEKEFELRINESITLPVEIGDTLLMGKFKNHPVVVKTIGKDEHGMPTINGKKVVTFRFGKKGPNIFDNYVEMEDTNMVTEDLTTGFKNLGISRKLMPQINSEDVKKYLKYIKENGYTYQIKLMSISKLNLTQGEINKDKVEQLMSTSKSHLAKPIIISSGNYILDGHHRVLALYALDNDAKIPVIQINLEIGKLLKLSRNWDDVSFKHVHESKMITEATHKLNITIPANIKKLHSVFKKNGKKLYIVGGAVRDAILGKDPHDFDLATDAKPEEVLAIAKKEGLHTAEVGKNFGVVIIDGDEIATFRKDIGKGRRPEAVDYTDIEGDVKRRDLTINALFYDIDRGEIVDLVGGIADLHKRNINTVGKAEERFDEDPLRKLRALRFHAKLKGNMDPTVMLALKKDPTLKGVSSERIREEFKKSIESAQSTKEYLELVDKLDFMKLLLPGLKVSKPYINENDPIILLSYILRNNSLDTLKSVLNKINYTKEEVRDIRFLVSLNTFTDNQVGAYKKDQKVTSLSDNQIIKYGKLIGTDFNKFIKFKTSVRGGEVPSDKKGNDIQKWIDAEETRRYLNEMARPELKSVEAHADNVMNPVDIEFTNHFFDRLNDPRNQREISPIELEGFFSRLSKHKAEFVDFLKQYREVMVKDTKTNLNIPFVKSANKLIAKTILRTRNWTQHKTAEFKFENNETITEGPAGSGTDLAYLIKHQYLPIFPDVMEKIIGKQAITAIHVTDVNNYKKVEDIQGTTKTISTFTNLTMDSPMMQNKGLRTLGGVFIALEGTLLLRSAHDIWSYIDVDGRKWVRYDVLFPEYSNYEIELKRTLDNNPTYSKYKQKLLKSIELSNTELIELVQSYIEILYTFMIKYRYQIREKFTGDINALEDGKWNELLISNIKIKDVIVKLKDDETDTSIYTNTISNDVEITQDINDVKNFIKQYGGMVTEQLTEDTKQRPTITFLVGPPASGKSTWVSKHGSGKVIISRDDIAEKVAKSHKISYNDLFDGTHEDLQKSIDAELDTKLMASLKSGNDIIVDMTNVSKKIRNGILARVSKKVYTRNAVVFNVSRPELLKRLQQREKETGKRISPEVLDDMLSRFEKPTKDEFDNITNEIINEEITNYPVNNQIKTFKDLFSKLPAELQQRIFGLKSIAQNPKWHPEGNVLKHTIMVVNRALKTAPGDIDLAIAAMFHDIGKDETSGIHPKTGQVTHYGHEFSSAQLVKKYSDTIKSLGGNVEDVFYIVNNHMRMKNYDIMRISKQRELNSHQSFGKLKHFSTKMDKGGLKDHIEELVNDMDQNLDSFVLPNKNF